MCRLLATLDLRLQVLDGAVHITDAARFGRAGIFEVFELGFELEHCQ